MTDKTIIQGNYADLRTIKTRSSVQMVIEFPIEQGQEIVEKFGFPQPAQEVPVAVARLALETSEDASSRQRDLGEGEDKPESYARQAKMLAKDEDFAKFVSQKHPEWWAEKYEYQTSHEICEYLIEDDCGVTSCADLIEDTVAGKEFKKLQAEFLNWKDRQEYEAHNG